MTDKPYDEYVDKAVDKAVRSGGLVDVNFKSYLVDAWLAGLAYSLDLIAEEKEKRNVQST